MEQTIYNCKNCGGVMVFDVKTQMLKCPNCDTVEEIPNDKDTIEEHVFNKNAIRRMSVSEKTSQTMQCVNCGAVMEIEQDCTAKQCPYCGSHYVLADQKEVVLPDGVVPFQIDKTHAEEIFAKWIKKCYFAPTALKKTYIRDCFNGIYMPYWTFDAKADCHYTAEGGKIRTKTIRKKDGSSTTRTYTDWYNTHGFIDHSFDDVQIPGTSYIDRHLMEEIEPYDTKNKLASYSQKYLSGYAAQTYQTPLDEAHTEARAEMRRKLEQYAETDVKRKYDTVRNVRLQVSYTDETFKYVLLPVYTTAFTYKEKKYVVLLNGQTGKINGEYPKSPFKIAICIFVILLAIAGIYGFWASEEADAYTVTESVYETNDMSI